MNDAHELGSFPLAMKIPGTKRGTPLNALTIMDLINPSPLLTFRSSKSDPMPNPLAVLKALIKLTNSRTKYSMEADMRTIDVYDIIRKQMRFFVLTVSITPPKQSLSGKGLIPRQMLRHRNSS